MFSLIISIIAIALVAVLALASIYYGGEAFNKGIDNSEATLMINQGSQIYAANEIANIDGNYIASGEIDTDSLFVSNDYLSEPPKYNGEFWEAVDYDGDSEVDYAFINVGFKEVCEQIEDIYDTDPTVSNIGLMSELVPSQGFGCVSLPDETYVGYYRI